MLTPGEYAVNGPANREREIQRISFAWNCLQKQFARLFCRANCYAATTGDELLAANAWKLHFFCWPDAGAAPERGNAVTLSRETYYNNLVVECFGSP
jgi:hypothetical protein